MNIINSIADMQALALAAKREGKRIAFVPTMGFLHEGHASLLCEGRTRGDLLVLSIFVNPIQFGQNEDLDRYPRDMERDCRIARECGVDIVFTPEAAEMYPQGFQTSISVRELSQPLCGDSRPGHFDGVATVVTKLFNIVMPDVALFGRKDYQQLAVITRMVADLSLPVLVEGMPIVRETDGLAMSSRNAYLSAPERESALCLYRSICTVRKQYAAGERSTGRLHQAALSIIQAEPAAVIDYLEFRDGTTLEPSFTAADGTLMALAVRIGKTRLIDNTVLGKEL
ncbi:pantoate--beta-alanine ligase [Geobacter sp. SVR]|uniref:pantoate--beta-alanine ligase n=1 Tax=Geobacter sp. SVR TaxID=2495594 RepID=UPI00143EF57E|nr:pantoate--beta-alanine ligase [Geobacter sp. SVR]BCS52258.1 pantothenate synthetase [Geobacter sp. SVR]GCF85081.1 pantothenate synthetase [Geobacter sp. SVR]